MTNRYFSAELAGALEVEPHVPKRKRDRCGFLHAEEAPEWPFPIVLVNRLPETDDGVGEHVHAVVLAVVGARPTREAKVE